MKLSEVMTTDVDCCERDRPLREVAELMRSRNIGSVPIVDGEKKVLGIVTDRDIVVRAVAAGRDPSRTSAAEVMSQDVISCGPDDSLDDAAELMKARQVRRILVCDARQKLLGIVALADLAVDGRDDERSGEVIEAVSEPAQPQ